MNVMGPCSALYESGPAVTCMRPLRISVQLRGGDGIQQEVKREVMCDRRQGKKEEEEAK
jgi:hypothetical protein